MVTSVHGRSLINQSVVSLLKAHRFARQIDDVELPLEETLPLLQQLAELNLGAASIDLARLNMRYKDQLATGAKPLEEFLRAELADVVDRSGIRRTHQYRRGPVRIRPDRPAAGADHDRALRAAGTACGCAP